MNQTKQTLIDIGFDHNTAEIYLILVEHGELAVPDILKYTTLSRGTVYDALAWLMSSEYALYRKEGRIAYYSAGHPSALASMFEKKKQSMKLLAAEMDSTVKTLTGSYNISYDRPGVRFFEGIEGFKEILRHTLTAKEKIRSFNYTDVVSKKIEKINEEYMQERFSKNIQKDIIFPETKISRKFSKRTDMRFTNVKYIPYEQYPFHISLQTYDDTVIYFNLIGSTFTSILIADPEIAAFHKSMHKFIWGSL